RVTSAPWWQRAAGSVRADLRAAAGVLGAEPAGLLPGLIVGDTGALPPRVEEEFLDAGLSHLMAVSGSNVTIVCGAVLLLARSVGAGPRLAAATAGVALLAFVLLVGYEPSALRAGVMGGIGLLALALGRRGS
ncbi:ComEC/Rec2 family competence protein, partial [Saccharomonospora iraqiensis]|uniref:ComEC/Rec2 family competence protein n=1 Tax=Saccharomonospora iraqiensis TaxID=52698 RepID=UPI000592BA31